MNEVTASSIMMGVTDNIQNFLLALLSILLAFNSLPLTLLPIFEALVNASL